MPTIVILSEAKNLVVPVCYTFEILRLTPQNDVVGQPQRGFLRSLPCHQLKRTILFGRTEWRFHLLSNTLHFLHIPHVFS